MTWKTVSVRIDENKLKRLDKLARITRRSRAWLINEAVDRYLSYEEWFIKADEDTDLTTHWDYAVWRW